MKKFLKKFKERFFKSPSSTEWVLLILVIAIIAFKFKSDPASRDTLYIDLKRAGDIVVPNPDKVNPQLKESYEPKYMKE